MNRLDGKVVLITGAARGQGRSHATTFAKEGADVIALDICEQLDTVPYPLASEADLKETVDLVEKLDRRIFAAQVDVRDYSALVSAFESGLASLGRIDIVIANAGIAPMSVRPHENEWRDVIDINLTGVYNTIRACAPTMIEQGDGGSIIITSSAAGLAGVGGNSPAGIAYTASKHGVVGLMRAYANYLAPHSIRVNTLHPTGVRTPMIMNDPAQEYIRSDPGMSGTNALPVSMVEPIDISNAALWLASDEGRYVSGVTLPVDAGYLNKK